MEKKKKVTRKTSKKKNNKKTKTTKKKKEIKKLSYKDLTIADIEKELKLETYKSKYKNVLMTTIYALIIIAAFAALVATLIMPVLQISGASMKPLYKEGDIVLSLKTINITSGDIIAFYHGNKILVKRVIAKSGQWVVISDDGNVYVDGILIEEPYVTEKTLGDSDIEYPYQVPDGSLFVLGDNRTNSIDSRNSEIGSIKQENIIGKIILKIWTENK